jgi:hypothetical protein
MKKNTNLNISVITNFGCRADCWYCIWKGHQLQYINEPTDWNKLEQFLTEHKSKGKVSVSGGGDCLYRYDIHAGWWIKFFNITNKLNMFVDIHTREKVVPNEIWDDKFWTENINRCVFSSDVLRDDIDYLRHLSALIKIRITHLVTANTTFEMIDDYLNFQKEIGCQFTLKELVGYDDNGMYKKIREKHPDIYHLDEGDYNIYYMPDNSVRDKFL